MNLSRQRCIRHPEREAAARCPACGRFFCRECVTEHEGRVLCAACINRRPGEVGETVRPRLRAALRATGTGVALAACFFLLWGFYALAGTLLHALPHRFHDSTAFERLWGDPG
jgi:hypothetical protein